MIRPLALATLLLLGGGALAQTKAPAPAAGTQRSSGLSGHDSNAPIDVSADHGTLASKDQRATLTGNVKAVQGDMTLTADQMVVGYTDKPGGGQQMQRLNATGNVFLRTPTETARSNYGIYDLDRKLITMVGGVVLNKNGNEVRSQRLVYDLNSGKANVDSSGQPGGRVTGHFTVPQKADQAPASSTPPAKPAG